MRSALLASEVNGLHVTVKFERPSEVELGADRTLFRVSSVQLQLTAITHCSEIRDERVPGTALHLLLARA